MAEAKTYTVTEMNRLIKDLVEGSGLVANVQVRGEISNFKRYPSGHCYFSLKDATGVLKCEEAAALGLMAGINASRKIDGLEPLILRRDQAYIGVMIDDLVTKGTEEPYRLMSSRAEFRLILRHDNADLRLTEIGHEIGLIKEERYKNFINKVDNINKAIEILKTNYLGGREDINVYLRSIDSNELTGGIQAFELLKRPNVSYLEIRKFVPGLDEIELDEFAIVFGEFNTLLSVEGRYSRENSVRM